MVKPPSMAAIRRDEEKRMRKQQAISFEEADLRVPDLIKERSILDTSKYALTALRLLAKYRKLPRHVVYKAVGAHSKSGGVGTGDFGYGMEKEGFILRTKERFHGKMMIMFAITLKGLQTLKSRLKH